VIIDTAANQKVYNGLAALGPTVTRPSAQGLTWNTRAQIDWIGRILGLTDAATKLNDRTAAHQADVRQANPAFTGKRIKVVTFTDSGLTVDLSASPAAIFLSSLGFTYDADYTSQTPSALEQPITGGSLYKTDDDDVTIVIRADKQAANGGFDGLPDEMLSEATQLVVVDDPDIISALLSGGPAATEYLENHFVKILKDKVR
jgi:eukaryotic-like serine/threonine-protein kinase